MHGLYYDYEQSLASVNSLEPHLRPPNTSPSSNLVAEWIHFSLFGIIVPTIKLKV